MYKVKEVFYTLQGEGTNAGRPAVFCRFTGCNLWSGREQDRARAICRFCDTDFVGGDKFTADGLADCIDGLWPGGGSKFVVCTGGEPLLQLDSTLIKALHDRGFIIAVETNGTVAAPAWLDWICVSPKAGTTLQITRGDELKLIYPQEGIDPSVFEQLDFEEFFLQPMDGPLRSFNTELALQYCLLHPRWRLSLQTHKLLGIR
jgi:7-carboxy-7-deazaguanine synthase (Cx14CxxC type)